MNPPNSFFDMVKPYLDPKNKVISYSLLQLSLYDILFALSILLFVLFRNALMKLQSLEEPKTDDLLSPLTELLDITPSSIHL